VPELEFTSQDVVRPLENPIKATGHIGILRGSLAPGSAVAKLTGKEGVNFEVLYYVVDESHADLERLSLGSGKML
jgi:dihydroxyacid dehydratase/phosphogluconate dehydratase